MKKFNCFLFILILIVIFSSGCLSTRVSSGDFDVSIKPAESYDGTLRLNPDGTLTYLLNINSHRAEIYYRIYDETDNIEIYDHIIDGSYDFEREIPVKFNNLRQSKEIVIYASNKRNFDKAYDEVISKSIILEPPNIDISISPKTTKWTQRKYQDKDGVEKYITITNTGNVKVRFDVEDSGEYSDAGYHDVIFHINMGSKILEPGESYTFSVYPVINDDTQIGRHESKQYFCALYLENSPLETAIFKKPFYLETTVIE